MFSFLKKSHFTKCHFEHGEKSHQRTACTQRGSVMLEVIAVLALMGVMGAMLYRQIYQRNQELHNIQMASEIRTIKEAFSAYIQAERSNLIANDCPVNPNREPVSCKGNTNDSEQYSSILATHIKTYLPDGWFNNNVGLLNASYTFSLWIYNQQDVTEKTVLYGVIVPTEATIPQTGWNFKRAARVALLVGADGGVYQSEMTGNNIAGALGTWQLEGTGVADPIPGLNGNQDAAPVFVAITGMDIFTPEYELPEAKVNLPPNWRLALERSHVWGQFSAGSPEGSGCYHINHDHADPTTGIIDSDTIDISCHPLFWVDNTNGGTVFVNSDLKVGKDGTEAITITQEGLVKQQTGLVIDKDGRIVSRKIVDTDKGTSAGEFRNDERYVVDPAYTSNMNDIRLASRGGARLSDILPNYILKDKGVSDCNIAQGNKNCNFNITNTFNCPTGYTKAFFVALLQSAADASIEANAHTHSNTGLYTGQSVTNTSHASRKYVATAHAAGEAATLESDSDRHVHSIPATSAANNRYATQIQNPTITVSNDNDATWTVKAELTSASSSARNMKFSWQTYCVFDSSSTSFSGKLPNKDNETQCKAAGFTWDPAKGCRYVYIGCNLIDSTAAITDKAAVCKAAGCKWTPGVGGADGTCAN